MSSNPFAASTSHAGRGEIVLSILPPATTVLQTLSYQYPLKLISPAVQSIAASHGKNCDHLVYTVFFLTYGGGLVAGDAVDLHVKLAPATRLVLLTQGSTKIFKSPSIDILTRQQTTVRIAKDAAICYLPDPVQPFEDSAFAQTQTYHLEDETSNLCVCDWVSEGRSARGEHWSFRTYTSRNEFWSATDTSPPLLLLRDNVILHGGDDSLVSIFKRMDGMGVFGTLILHGPMFQSLGDYFAKEFKLMPRIGNHRWDPAPATDSIDPIIARRTARLQKEKADGLLWTCAERRGFVLVKFAARDVQGARQWLRRMLQDEGTVEREFGERALLCLK